MTGRVVHQVVIGHLCGQEMRPTPVVMPPGHVGQSVCCLRLQIRSSLLRVIICDESLWLLGWMVVPSYKSDVISVVITALVTMTTKCAGLVG